MLLRGAIEHLLDCCCLFELTLMLVWALGYRTANNGWLLMGGGGGSRDETGQSLKVSCSSTLRTQPPGQSQNPGTHASK